MLKRVDQKHQNILHFESTMFNVLSVYRPASQDPLCHNLHLWKILKVSRDISKNMHNFIIHL